MNRKYIDVAISFDVNCTSSIDYFADAKLIQPDGRYRAVHFHINSWDGIGKASYLNLPRYAKDMIMRRLQLVHTAGRLRVFEYNKDGVKRYSKLRYHDPEILKLLLFAWIVPEVQ